MSSDWIINQEGKVLINCYDIHNNSIDVHNIRTDFNHQYIREANLTRLGVGKYGITFNISNKIGKTEFVFNVDGKEQLLKIEIKEEDYSFNIFNFFRENLWIVVIVFLVFIMALLIVIIALVQSENEATNK